MATLVLSTVGSTIGGPFGSAIGGLIGRQVDHAIFGIGSVEGPRLQELSVTTSSYGQAIPRRFGRMRVAGTIIWATDLIESSETEGGKGQPSQTNYSYSVSFAVAVSSRPIEHIGRIWADGTLLRGESGDLKVGGEIRTHLGNGDGFADPLIQAELGNETPGFRDYAYVVFEDLQLEGFGNRIPALTFEVFAAGEDEISLSEIVPQNVDVQSNATLKHAKGFADEGGPVSSSLAAIDRVYPLTAVISGTGISIISREEYSFSALTLPEKLASQGSEDASQHERKRSPQPERKPLALRYYDEDLDYQPSVQRALGKRGEGSEAMVDLPATLTADGAKQLVNSTAHRSRWRHEQINWRTNVLDPSLLPGQYVKVADYAGYWLISAWEWHETGVDYSLERAAPKLAHSKGANAGRAQTAADIAVTESTLSVFESPPISFEHSSQRTLFAAATSAGSAWKGASLYLEQGGSLLPIGTTGSKRAVSGFLVSPAIGSKAVLMEPSSSIEVELIADDLGFEDTDLIGLLAGANQLMVGSEAMQFMLADSLGGNRWRLSTLLRGRAGTEDHAFLGHPIGTNVTLIDQRVTRLDASIVPSHESTRLAAIGIGDGEPFFAPLENVGLSLRPPSPVHPKVAIQSDASTIYRWIRRARGAWEWKNGIEAPLVEENELYLIGFGPTGAPNATWESNTSHFTLSSLKKAELLADYGPDDLWVKQIGEHSLSGALLLAKLS